MNRRLQTLLLLLLLAIGALLLNRELSGYHYADLVRELRAIAGPRLLLAGLLTGASFLALTGYDVLALRHAGHPLPYRQVALASFAGYAIGNSLGFPLLTGAPLRYRLYNRWGVPGAAILQVIGFYATSLWLGILAVGGVAFLFHPLPTPAFLHLPVATLRPVGGVMLAAVVGYLVLGGSRWRRLRVGPAEFAIPGFSLALRQVGLAALDWLLAAGVMYVLLPGAVMPLGTFIAVFVLAQTAGIVSHVPGGLGVFESVMLLFLATAMPAPQLLGVLLAYRGVYYLLPLLLAIVAIGGYELRLRWRPASADTPVGRWILAAVPQLAAAGVFLAGLVLLVSGATPAVRGRLAWLDRLLPLAVIELSHLFASVVGVLLLLLARGLQRRLNAAFHLTVLMLGAGIALSLLKGLDYEEAIALGVVLVVLWASRGRFNRPTALLDERFTPGWVLAVALVVGSTAWLGFFAFRHVEYSSDLWWRFAPHADAPRFLRSTVAVAVVLGAVAVARLLRPARAAPGRPDPEELARAEALVQRYGASAGNLALLGDKSLFFASSGEGFLMYGVAGRSWIAMGDPVAPPAEQHALAWRFRELADAYAAWPAFYQVRPETLPIYLEMGLTLSKLGEEAMVPLAEWTLDRPSRRSLRKSVRHAEKAGCVFEVVPRSAVPAILPELRVISDEWLAGHPGGEKGFSLGRFDEQFLARFDIAVVRVAGRIVAFANIWRGAPGSEAALDLMRHGTAAPNGTMDFLIASLIAWARNEGFAWFTLGMAPLSGVESRRLAPLRSRIGRLVFRHGERFYPFQGLRRYKEKFDPEWQPRYLAAPGGLTLPWVLAGVNRLVSGVPSRPRVVGSRPSRRPATIA